MSRFARELLIMRHAKVAELLGVLADCPSKARRVLMVGHNPGLEELVCYLARATDLPEPGYGFFKTAALARLRLPGGWGELQLGSLELLHLATPKTLPPG
jgi:phosphohistidine phosphatase